MRNARIATLAYVAILLLLFATESAVAADDAALGDDADPAMTVDEATPLPEDTPTPVPTATASATPTPPAGAPEATVAPAVTRSEGNNAARRGGSRAQRTKAKAWEAKYRCLPNPSRMMARGGTAIANPGPRLLAWLAYVIAGTCALLVLGGFVIRRRSKGAEAKPGPGLLEVVATVIGLCATATGLLTWFAPDLAARATPASKVEMEVQSVNTRIAHGEFVANEERTTRLHGTDRREVGNVIWLNLHLVGYRGKELHPPVGLVRAPHGRRADRGDVGEDDVHASARRRRAIPAGLGRLPLMSASGSSSGCCRTTAAMSCRWRRRAR